MSNSIVNSRNDFCLLIDEMGLRVGVELGVASGGFSEVLLSNSKLEVLYSIDRWSDHHDENEFQFAKQRLSKYDNRSIIVRASFNEALCKFSDEFFDFIYIDGYAHTGQNSGQTLNDWYPKLKTGGVFAGHDYHVRWQPTIDVVNLFVNLNNKQLNTTKETDPNTFPSWWIIK